MSNKPPQSSSSSSLLETHAEQLLNEFCTILSEKWPFANLDGHSFLKNVINGYTSVLENESDNEENENEKQEKYNLKLSYINLTRINECSANHSKLEDDILKTFEKHLNRMLAIKESLFKILEMNLKIFSRSKELDLVGFKQDLNKICDSYSQEFALKSKLVSQCLFRSRFNRVNQIAIVSAWIHQPFLNEYLDFKFISYVKFYFLTNKRNN